MLTATASSSLGEAQAPETSGDSPGDATLIASVVLERLPVILPELPEWEKEYKAFSFARQQQYRKEYPAEFLEKSSGSADEDEEGELSFEPAPRITEGDRTNDVRSLLRSLDQRLYLVVQGRPLRSLSNEPKWHFVEKEYANEDTMRQCAENALRKHIYPQTEVYFVGNAPCGHLPSPSNPSLKRFFFRSQILGSDFSITDGGNIRDFAWVTKEELLASYLPDSVEADFFKKLLI